VPERRGGKILVTILCGAGDRPIARLGGRTPLEAADTPHLDDLARRGAAALIDVIGADVTPESDSGAMALLGYDPLVHYTGRGALEGLGMGFWDGTGSSVGFRVNFASQDRASGRLDRRTARDLTDPELQQLAGEIRAAVDLSALGIEYRMKAFGRHRGILGFTSHVHELSGEVSNTDPGFRRVGAFGIPNEHHGGEPDVCLPLEDGEPAARTARAVNEFVRQSSEVLAASEVNARRVAEGKLPANVVLFRDAGHALPSLEGFAERTGRSLALYGQVPAEHGLCRLIGGRFVESKPADGQPEEEYYVEVARALFDDPADVILVHLKGADEPGHDDQPEEKAAALERIDRFYARELVEHAGPDDLVVFTGDHATPCELGIHSTDPVPTVACGPGVEPDDRVRFTEADAAAGGLPVRRAVELMPFLARQGAAA
jgi:2,3-bisphosphoglycerate-independent phosphoglycerate mutase